MIMTADPLPGQSWLSYEGDTMFTFMLTDEDRDSIQQAHRRMIIVGVDDSAEAEAAAKWAVREAELRKDDLMLVHAYEVPLSSRGRPAAIARGREQQEALLDKFAGTLTLPPTMHLDRLVEVDSPGFLLPRLAEQAELTVLGQDHPALSGQMPLGHTANTVATMSRRPIVAVPRGWSPVSDDRRPIAVAIDGRHSSSSTSASPSRRGVCARSRYWWFIRHRYRRWNPASRTQPSISPRFWLAGGATIPTSTCRPCC